MSDATNLELIRNIYAAFGRGDVPAVLAALDERVDWRVIGPVGLVPYAGSWPGRAGVGDFFAALGAALEIAEFEPQQFLATGETVVVLGRESGRARPTGKPHATEWVHVFTIRAGRVVAFREYSDASAVAEAFS